MSDSSPPPPNDGEQPFPSFADGDMESDPSPVNAPTHRASSAGPTFTTGTGRPTFGAGDVGGSTTGSSFTTASGFRLGSMTLADVLDTTFALLKRSWRAMLTLTVLFSIPGALAGAIVSAAFDLEVGGSGYGIFTAISQPQRMDDMEMAGGTIAGVIAGLALSFLVTLFLLPLVQGAVTRLAAAAFLGRPLTAKDAVRSMLPLWPTLIGATLLSGLAIMSGLIIFIIGVVVTAVLFSVWFAAIVPVIAVEETGVMGALRRSKALMSTRFWPYLGTLALASFVSSFVGNVASFLPVVLAQVARAISLLPLAWFLESFGVVITYLITIPVSAIVALLLYFDARVRAEGFDVQMMAAQVTGSPDPVGPASPTPAV